MAPLSQAMNVEPALFNYDGTSLHRGTIDPDYNVASVPNGGYILGLVIEACMKHQMHTPLRDPIHVTAHFLQAAAISTFEVHVHTIRPGKSFTNVVADFKQQSISKLTAHIIFGVLSSAKSASDPLPTLAPPSPYARRIPLLTHPSRLQPTRWSLRPVGYTSRIFTTEDPAIEERNKLSPEDNYSGKELEWGAWMMLAGGDEQITTPSLAFLVDNFASLTELISLQEQGHTHGHWMPTLALSIEFKFPIPTTKEYAKRTVGVYAKGRYINNPQSRHETIVEVWSAPSNIGENADQWPDDWRDKQICLAISSQMAVTVPMATNRRKGERAAAGSKL